VPDARHALDRERTRHVLSVPAWFARVKDQSVAGASLDSLCSTSGLDIRATFGFRAADPQDVAHSAFARYVSIDVRQAVENPRAFLYTTARNIALDITRHIKHTQRQAAAE
jgi:hypothetical protein